MSICKNHGTLYIKYFFKIWKYFFRAERGEDRDDSKEAKEELSKSRKQIEASRLRLTKLIEDGVELVTNIRVGCDAREAARRGEEEIKKQDR